MQRLVCDKAVTWGHVLCAPQFKIQVICGHKLYLVFIKHLQFHCSPALLIRDAVFHVGVCSGLLCFLSFLLLLDLDGVLRTTHLP